MRRSTLSRDFFIPKGAMKVADKNSDAIAYLYTTTTGKPAMAVFYGKQAKPVARFYYNMEETRNDAVRTYFKRRQQVAAYKAEQRAARKQPRKVEVGGFYYTSWGYDQTNIDFYEIVELVGATSARVRPVKHIDASKGNEAWATGKSIPAAGEYTGPAVLVRVTGDSFKVDGHYAHRWDGAPVSWTAYA